MVEKNFNIFNFKPLPSLNLENLINSDNKKTLLSVGNHNNDNKNDKDSKFKYVNILVNDPFNNRDIILKITKKQKGIYI